MNAGEVRHSQNLADQAFPAVTEKGSGLTRTPACLLCERAMEDGRLCLQCTKDTRVRLESMTVLYDGLAALLAPSGGVSLGRPAKPAYAPLPVSEDVLDLRGQDGMIVPLESWVDAIRAERGRPERPHQGSPTGRVKRAAGELLGHLPWVAVTFTEAGLFAGEIRELTRSVQSVLQPRERGMRLGRCAALMAGGEPCGATLRLMPGEKVARCRWCATVWPPATWPQLKAWQDEDEEGTRIVGTPGGPQEMAGAGSAG